MKKAIFILFVFAFSACKKNCDICTNSAGQAIREKCFRTQSEKNEYYANEVGKPDAERCR